MPSPEVVDRIHELQDALDRVTTATGTFAGQVSWGLEHLKTTDLSAKQQLAWDVLRDALLDLRTAMGAKDA